MAKPTPAEPAVMTLSEAAAYLRLDPKTIVRYVREQRLRGRQCGRHWRFLRSTLEEFVNGDRAA